MQANGLRDDQVSQVRGFADQKLRVPKDPLEPSNRRITLIVQYVVKNDEDEPVPAAGAELSEASEKTAEKSEEKPGEKPAEAPKESRRPSLRPS